MQRPKSNRVGIEMKTDRLSRFASGPFFWKTSRSIAAWLAACTLAAGLATPVTAAGEKTAAQYSAEAAAWEAEADRLLSTAPARPATRNVATTGRHPVMAAAGGDRVFSGVYGCMNQDGYEAPTMQWGILDGANYSDFDGHRGSYSYNSATHVLTFTSGPFRGLRRLRTDPRVFRILDEHGGMTPFSCPWTPKDPRKIHW